MLRTQPMHLLAGGALLLLCACGPSTRSTCTVVGVSLTASQNPVDVGVTTTLTAAVTSTGSSCMKTVTWSMPSGATLTPSGNSAAFSSMTVGSYTVVATSTDDNTKTGTVTMMVAPAVALWDVAEWDTADAVWQ